VGIVLFNNDLIFPLLNVVSHGIPYLALVWAGGLKPAHAPAPARHGTWAGRYGLAVFIGAVVLFAFLEEACGMGWFGASTARYSAFFSTRPPWPARRCSCG
jgi:hypothetical protein